MNINTALVQDCNRNEEIIELFQKIDEDSTGYTYDISTSDMGRNMFSDLSGDESDQEILEKFYYRFADEVIFAEDSDSVIGFTIFRENDPYFRQAIPDYTPNIAVNYSGVHPDYQQQGVWTRIRDELEEIATDRSVPYILTSAQQENKISIEANKKRGFSKVLTTDTVDGVGETMLFAKQLDGGSS